MGGACSRKKDQLDHEDILQRGISRRFSKNASSKWLATSFTRSCSDVEWGNGKCPSLMELCIQKACENRRTFSVLPRDLSQQVFNALVSSQRLTAASLEAFRDRALQSLR